MKILRFLTLLMVGFAFAPFAHAQGFLPPVSSSFTTTMAEPRTPIAVGQAASKFLYVLDDQGRKRSLISYKSYLEELVILFLSPRCTMTPADWIRLRQLNERYKDWHVAFVVLNTSAPEMRPELEAALRQQKIPWPTAQDERRTVSARFTVSGVPEILILDEGSVLRFRGPLGDAAKALEAVIGHTETVTEPEPTFVPTCAL